MATYYVDPAASGAGDGSSWTDAWTDLQSAADNATAGDTVYCRGTQTLSAPIDFDTNEGSVASGLIKFIGCNASGTVEGTRFVLDGNSSASVCMAMAAKDYLWFENLELKNATGSGADYNGSGAENHTWVNCYSHNNGAAGWDTYYDSSEGLTFIRCVAKDNTAQGWKAGYRFSRYVFCYAIDNGDNGFELEANYGNVMYGCISHGNGGRGIDHDGARNAVIANCVIDGNTSDGIGIDDTAYVLVVGNRITNNGGYGINTAGAVDYGWNFFNNNTSGNTNGGVITPIPDDADSDTNETSGTEGYNNRANDDFNLTDSATLRSVGIELGN